MAGIKGKGGVAGRSGPPKLNLNATKNGARISRLTLGELPNTMRRQLQNARKYRRELEKIVFETHGEVNATQAHLIDEAVAAEVHASVCRWLLRTRLVPKDTDKQPMSTADVTRCSEQILRAKTIRNRAIERLKLNEEPEPPDLQAYIIETVNGKTNG
jgi:hypothetical protein